MLSLYCLAVLTHLAGTAMNLNRKLLTLSVALIPGEKQTYLSMWNGYVDPSKPAYNETLAKSLGEGFLYKHTSGHCDMNSLRDVFRLLHPKAIIPIHTEKPEAFAQFFSDEWPVVVLNDGDSYSPT